MFLSGLFTILQVYRIQIIAITGLRCNNMSSNVLVFNLLFGVKGSSPSKSFVSQTPSILISMRWSNRCGALASLHADLLPFVRRSGLLHLPSC